MSFNAKDYILGYLAGLTGVPAVTLDYSSGFSDARLAPAPIPELSFKVDQSYFVDIVKGNDSFAGTTSNSPFKTMHAAEARANIYQAAAPTAFVAIYLACGNPPCLENAGGKAVHNRLYGAYNKATVEDNAKMGGPSPFAFIVGGSNVHIKDIGFLPMPGSDQHKNIVAILFNGPVDVSVTFCDIEEYGINISFQGQSGTQEIRIENNCIGKSWLPVDLASVDGRSFRSQGIYTTHTKNPIVRGNRSYKNGYRNNDINMSDKRTWKQFEFSHGWYQNESASAPGGTEEQNIWWANATTGPMMRMGGACQWDIFAYNGNAADVFGGSDSFLIQDSVFLGCPPEYKPVNFPGWGGGIECSARSFTARRLLFLYSNQNYGASFPPPPFYLHAPPQPGLASATIDSISGVHPNCLTPVTDKNHEYHVSQNNISLRRLRTGEVLPDMLDWLSAVSGLSVVTEEQGWNLLKKTKRDSEYGAAAAVMFFRRAAMAIL